jgi:lipoate-protein ligase A
MIDTLSAEDSMKIDAGWIEALPSTTKLCFRAYKWQTKSITYGHFIPLVTYVDVEKARSLGFAIAKRPTGGGVMFHYHDFSYAVAVPSSHPAYSETVLENYRFINSCLLQAIQKVVPHTALLEQTVPRGELAHFCMATPTKYDLIAGGKKIGGSAQRKTKWGFVHQGSVFLAPPVWEEIAQVVIHPEQVIEPMQHSMASLFCNQSATEAFLAEAREAIYCEMRILLSC